MILYRIGRKNYINDLSGTGALLFGGRWNAAGIRALYTSGSVSLAVLEVIANLSAEKIDTGLYVVELNFPDDLAVTVPDHLPEHWNAYPYVGETVKLGSQFLKSGGLCLKVPSALVSTEYNYILNPNHESFDQIKIVDTRPLILDKRLMK